jgi:hypothetical protein
MPAAPLAGEERPTGNYSPQICVRMNADEYNRLMTAVKEQDRPVSRIVREALRSWFDAHTPHAPLTPHKRENPAG